jgi:hypothetical protein
VTGPLDLCRQSFSKPVSNKPISCGLNVILPKFATILMPRDGDIGATTFKDGRQFASLTSRNQRIYGRRADEYEKIAKVPNYLGNQRYGHSEKNRTCKVMRMKQNQTRGEVCTIRMPNDNQSSRAEPISFGSGADELRQLFSSGPDIIDANLRESPEGRRHAILQNLAS